MHFLKKIATLGLFLSSFSLLNLDAMSSKKRKTEQQAVTVQGKKNKVSVKKNKVCFSFKQKEEKEEKKSLYDFMPDHHQRIEMLSDFERIIEKQILKQVKRFSINELCLFPSLKGLVDLLEKLAQELCRQAFDGMEPPKLFIDMLKGRENRAHCWFGQNEIAFGYEKIESQLLGISENKKEKFRAFVWTFCHELGHRYTYLYSSYLTKAFIGLKTLFVAPFVAPFFLTQRALSGYMQRFNELAADDCATRACYHIFEDFNPETDVFFDREKMEEYQFFIPLYQSLLATSYKSQEADVFYEQFKYEPLHQPLREIGKHLCQKPYEISEFIALIKSKIHAYNHVAKNRFNLQEQLKKMMIEYAGYRYCEGDVSDRWAIFCVGDNHPSNKTRREHAKKIIERMRIQK